VNLPKSSIIDEIADHRDELLNENRKLNQRIKRLEEALGCVVVDCNHLHHRKKHQHRSGEPCPVEELIRKAKEAKP
jgi:archaellum component FlaC